jgi:multisubunit Na+/H+ antiporter MnhF subunit
VNGFGWCACALLIGGVGPAVLLASRGDAARRMVGLQLGGAVTILLLMLLAHTFGQPSYLVVPFVAVPLSVAGTFVFTRLLPARRS